MSPIHTGSCASPVGKGRGMALERAPGTERAYCLHDPDGKPIGCIEAPEGRPRLGWDAPTVYLRRLP
ncbi:MAG TPA: hypothetical protein VNI61_00835 [Gemmatimonadales bacterium]|nr:hypothetical protein [Gemmatimonadales bacterium]